MRSFEVKADTQAIAEALLYFEFVGGNTSDAIRIAINKTLPIARTAASKGIRSQVRLKAAYLNKKDDNNRRRLDFTRASSRKLVGKITTPSRGLLLSRYSTDSAIANNGEKTSLFRTPEVPARGIRVKIKPKGGTQIFGKSYFYMIFPKSHAIGIVRRRPKGQLGPKKGKYKVLYAPSLSQVFSDVRDEIAPKAADTYTEQLRQAMGFILRKKHPKE